MCFTSHDKFKSEDFSLESDVLFLIDFIFSANVSIKLLVLKLIFLFKTALNFFSCFRQTVKHRTASNHDLNS